MPVSVRLLGPASVHQDAMLSGLQVLPSAAGACGHANEPLFLAGNNEDEGVPMDLFLGPSPRSCAHGRASPVCPAAAAAIAAAAATVSSSSGAHGAPQFPPCAALVVVNSENEEFVRSSVRHARAATLAHAVGRVFTSAACASAGMVPAAAALAAAAPRCFRRPQSNRQLVDYAINPHNATHQSGSSAGVSAEGGEVAPATAASVSTLGATPLPGSCYSCGPGVDVAPVADASVSAACGSQPCPA